MIKLVAIDLDDTLLNDKKEITAENRQALQYAHEKNVKVVICTGRPYLAMNAIVKELGFTHEDDYIITFNGAQVRRAGTGEVVTENVLSKADVLAWHEQLTALSLPLDAIGQRYLYLPTTYPAGFPSLYAERLSNLETQVVEFHEFPTDQVINKMVVCTEAEHLDMQLAKIDPEFRAQYSTFKSRTFLLEIVAKGVSKGNTLRELGEVLNILPEEMMTIGDQENDVSMIELAGVGVAMDNAVPAAKQVADYITADNNSNGVAQAIYHFIK